MENANTFKGRYQSFSKEWGTQISIGLALIGICIVFGIASPYFFTLDNFTNLGHSVVILGIMAAGTTVPMILGAMDVSQYSINALIGISCVMLGNAGLPVGVCALYAIAGGMMLGAVNGVAVSLLKINPIIATLATGMIMRGFCYMLTEGATMSINEESYKVLGRVTFAGIPLSVIIMIATYLLIFVMLKYTPFGRKVFAVGGNPEAAYLSGINLKTVRFGGFIVSGATAGLAGFILLSQLGAFQPNTGESTLMNVIAAVILGGVSLSGGKAKLIGTLLGVLILTVIQNGMNLLGVQTYYQNIVRGIIILVAVYLDVLRGGGYK